MCFVNFCAGRGGKALHTVIASTEQASTDEVNSQVYPSIDSLDMLAISLEYFDNA
jgi:hypothetical protein